MAATLEQLTEAMVSASGQTPLEVIDAFCPKGAKVGGLELVELTAGHDLFLSRIKHPLISGTGNVGWSADDLAVLFFAFTRPSRELFRLIREDGLEEALHDFLDELPLATLENAAADIVSHWLRARASALPMVAPHAAGSKKKRVSAGGLR